MKPPAAAAQLGYAGLAPFFAAAGAALLGPAEIAEAAMTALLLYGGLILSFMGGCRWGFSAAGLGQGPTLPALALSVAPALWAFAALGLALVEPRLLSPSLAALMLMAAFIALWAADRAAAAAGEAPDWWPALRGPLTTGACLSLGLGAVA